jgi:hypothetical protein
VHRSEPKAEWHLAKKKNFQFCSLRLSDDPNFYRNCSGRFRFQALRVACSKPPSRVPRLRDKRAQKYRSNFCDNCNFLLQLGRVCFCRSFSLSTPMPKPSHHVTARLETAHCDRNKIKAKRSWDLILHSSASRTSYTFPPRA